MKLPLPSTSALQHSQQLAECIKQVIAQQGPISFADYMQMALYYPALGYYSAGATKLGAAGDFITAPELSSLFSFTLAHQVAEVLQQIPNGDVLEFGAGSGCMAADILLRLHELDCLPQHYYILDVSADLQQRQQQTIAKLPAELSSKVQWLTELPKNFYGAILANEVLDAMPVHMISRQQNGLFERKVTWDHDAFQWLDDSISSNLLSETQEDLLLNLPAPYVTEINTYIDGWLESLNQILQQGVILIIDYGFSAAEYYHPQRHMGTLMCHYQHHAHPDPFLWPGLQDITAHVDFTHVATAATQVGLDVLGYTHQASFLMAAGIMELVQSASTEQQYRFSQQLKRLLLPTEMGELFKVMALGKQWKQPLIGFQSGFSANLSL
jgi:SAM-dependent MidA family methyltransferase